MASGLVASHIAWPEAYRLVPSPEPAIAALASLIDEPGELEGLLQVEALTNPLAREAAGNLPVIPVERRYRGPLAGLVMMPFVLLRPSRFSAGLYGVLYVADVVQTALAEAAHHSAERLSATKAPPGTTVRLFGYTLNVAGNIVDAQRGNVGIDDAIYARDSWTESQRFGKTLRDTGHLGLHYTSVRRPSGSCVGAFRPEIVGTATRGSQWLLFWNGEAFEYQAEDRGRNR